MAYYMVRVLLRLPDGHGGTKTIDRDFGMIQADSDTAARKQAMKLYNPVLQPHETEYSLIFKSLTVVRVEEQSGNTAETIVGLVELERQFRADNPAHMAARLLHPLVVLAPRQVAAKDLVPIAIDQLTAVEALLRKVNGAFDDSGLNPNQDIPQRIRDHVPTEVNTAIGKLRDAQSLLSTFLQRV